MRDSTTNFDFAEFEPDLIYAIRQMQIESAEAITADRRALTPEAMAELKEWAERRNTQANG